MLTSLRHIHEPLITYWDRIRSALMTLGDDTCMTLTQIFWLQSHLKVVESGTMFFNNGDVRKEFTVKKHYIGLALTRPALLSRMGVNCYEYCMVFVQVGDEEHPSQFGWWKHCLHPILFELAPTFIIKVEYCCPSTKDQKVLCIYLIYDIKKCFKWTGDSAHILVWINTDTIFSVWKPREGLNQKH